MKNYKNNIRRNRFRNNGDRNYIRNGSNQKLVSDFSNSPNFKRKYPGKNNQNASKLIEKYTTLAKEALSNGDKILSENYLQHADHFVRIMSERQKEKNTNSIKENETNQVSTDKTSLKESELEAKTENL